MSEKLRTGCFNGASGELVRRSQAFVRQHFCQYVRIFPHTLRTRTYYWCRTEFGFSCVIEAEASAPKPLCCSLLFTIITTHIESEFWSAFTSHTCSAGIKGRFEITKTFHSFLVLICLSSFFKNIFFFVFIICLLLFSLLLLKVDVLSEW